MLVVEELKSTLRSTKYKFKILNSNSPKAPNWGFFYIETPRIFLMTSMTKMSELLY